MQKSTAKPEAASEHNDTTNLPNPKPAASPVDKTNILGGRRWKQQLEVRSLSCKLLLLFQKVLLIQSKPFSSLYKSVRWHCKNRNKQSLKLPVRFYMVRKSVCTNTIHKIMQAQ